MLDTKIAIVLRDDLAAWQKLNMTAFLTSGLVGAAPSLLGEPYEDADGNRYHPLVGQPMIVLSATAETIRDVYRRAMDRQTPLSLFIDDMFTTPHDLANRAAVRQYARDALPIAGLALHDRKNVVDKITKGARMHP